MEQIIAAAKTFFTDVLFKSVPKLILALVVLYVGWKLINLLNKFLKKKYESHQVDRSLQQFLHSLIDITLKVLLVFTAVGIMGIKTTSFMALLGAAGVAIGMGLQGTLQNFAGGVIILLLRPFRVGDYVEQGSYEGFVENIQIFNTTLRTYDNRNIVVPNTELATKSLVNHFNLPARRVTIKVGIAYGQSVEKAREVALNVINAHEEVLQSPKPPKVFVDSLGDSSVNLIMFVWTTPDRYWDVLFSLNEEIYETFHREGISIPFNQVDVHIKQD